MTKQLILIDEGADTDQVKLMGGGIDPDVTVYLQMFSAIYHKEQSGFVYLTYPQVQEMRKWLKKWTKEQDKLHDLTLEDSRC